MSNIEKLNIIRNKFYFDVMDLRNNATAAQREHIEKEVIRIWKKYKKLSMTEIRTSWPNQVVASYEARPGKFPVSSYNLRQELEKLNSVIINRFPRSVEFRYDGETFIWN